MAQVNILVAVNVSAAVNNNNLPPYVFMMDSNDSSGTQNHSEGTNELVTHVTNGDTIVWRVVSIDPTQDVAIHSFTSNGTTIPDLINPAPYPQFDGSVWGGHVNQAANNAQYSMVLLLNGRHLMTFDPFIDSVNPT